MKKVGFLGIDFQMDFMDLPGAALPVPGANADAERIAEFITRHVTEIHALYLTQDSHHALDIAHPKWWKKSDGSFVDPFTAILPEDLSSGKYYPAVHPSLSVKYVNDLTIQGEFIHFIWPEHCLIGSPGHAFHPAILQAVREWETRNGKFFNPITKGSNPFTEHFGAFRANIPQANDPSTQISQALLLALHDLDVLYFAGEAEDYCDANSLRQLCDEAPALLPKMVILQDGMSRIPGLPSDHYKTVDAIYDRARQMGAKIAKTTDITSL